MKLGISSACLYPMETDKAFLSIVKNEIPVCAIFFNAACDLSSQFIDELNVIRNSGNTRVASVHPMMSLAESFLLFSAYDRRYQEGLDGYKR